MLKGTDFQVDEDIATQDAVVEDEIDAIVLIADRDAKLPCFKTKPGAEFEEESLHVIEQRGFEIAIEHGRFRGREAVLAFLVSPLMMPGLVVGVAMLQFFV